MTFTRFGHACAAILFVAMAALQLNDPDPLLWVVLYLSIAAVPVARIFKRHEPVLYGIAWGLSIAGLAISLDGFFSFVGSGDYTSIGGKMSVHQPHIEPAREFLGTLIGVTCLIFYKGWHTN